MGKTRINTMTRKLARLIIAALFLLTLACNTGPGESCASRVSRECATTGASATTCAEMVRITCGD